MTSAGLIARFPELATIGATADGLAAITSAVADATLRVDPLVWTTSTEDGIAWLAMSLLASSPYGRNARMAAQDDVSTYRIEYERLLATVVSGFRVI